jgi:hypothetical protein
MKPICKHIHKIICVYEIPEREIKVMARPYKDIIRTKKKLFKDFFIPWDNTIEYKLEDAMKANPFADPEIILDRICRTYINRKLKWTQNDVLKARKGV